jgi:hypothetical protein
MNMSLVGVEFDIGKEEIQYRLLGLVCVDWRYRNQNRCAENLMRSNVFKGGNFWISCEEMSHSQHRKNKHYQMRANQKYENRKNESLSSRYFSGINETLCKRNVDHTD